MKKIGIVTKREYLRRVNKKSFILITLLGPLLFSALVFVPLWLSSIKSSEVYEIAIIDLTGKYAPLFKDTDSFKFFGIEKPVSAEKSKENHSTAFAFLEISDDLLENADAAAIYSDVQIPPDLIRKVNNTLNQHLEKEKRASFNIPNLDEIIEKSRVNINVKTIKWDKDGETKETSSEISSAIGMFFTFLIYMFIMLYGAMVMQGVMEEKTNRIVEVIISSVRPFDLMMGKIIGIGLVGLTQVFIWCLLTIVLVSTGSLAFNIGDAQEIGAVHNVSVANNILSKLQFVNFAEIIFYFVVCFIGGYLLYASIFAAVGAVVDNPEDSQQFTMPIMIFLMFAVYAGMYSVQNPDGPLAFWCSFIPLTSPVVMMVRIPYDMPFWQISVSLFLLFSSVLLSVGFAAKIYRVGILMYGKKPSIKEIIRWVKYSN